MQSIRDQTKNLLYLEFPSRKLKVQRFTGCLFNAWDSQEADTEWICCLPLITSWRTTQCYSTPFQGSWAADLWTLQWGLARGRVLCFREIVLPDGIYPFLERRSIISHQVTDEVSFKMCSWFSRFLASRIKSWVQGAQPYSGEWGEKENFNTQEHNWS